MKDTKKSKEQLIVELVESEKKYRIIFKKYWYSSDNYRRRQNKGILYDPEVVDACLRLFEEKGFKFE